MIVTVRFPIINTVRIDDPWPLKVGSKTFFIENENGRATTVGVRFAGVPTDAAPKFEHVQDGLVKGRVTDRSGPYLLLAEYDLRAWQTLLVAYILVDIDFDSPTTEFKPETQEEESLINIHNFSTKIIELHHRGTEEFALYGRAFLALDLGRPLIELMSLYRDALKALFAGRYIDAYNYFYLFLETQFCRGRTATNQASTELVKNTEFMSALQTVAGRTADNENFKKLRFKSLEKWKDDPRSLVKEIVELRGLLRHHSLNSPHRWDPNRQENYEIEARFLSIVAYEIAFPKVTGKLWDSPYPEEFSKMANERHMSITVHVNLTIRDHNHLIRDVGIDMTFPQRNLNARLAHVTLTKALEVLDEKSPGAELYAIRAWIKSKGTELFRYDVGASLPR